MLEPRLREPPWQRQKRRGSQPGASRFTWGPSRSPSHTRRVCGSQTAPTHPCGDSRPKEEAKGTDVCRGTFSRELNKLQESEKPKII